MTGWDDMCGLKGTAKSFCHRTSVDGAPCFMHRDGFVHFSRRPGFKHWARDLAQAPGFTTNLDVMRRELDRTYPKMDHGQ